MRHLPSIKHMNPNSTLCTAFQERARETWDFIQGNTQTPVTVHEESITEINLQRLSRVSSHDLIVIPFTKKQESRVTGADWEWWFIDGRLTFGAAVQAKRLRADNTYDIGYTPKNQTKLQIETLLEYAGLHSLSPLYALYNFWIQQPTSPSKRWPCGSVKSDHSLYGCSVVSAQTAQQLLSQKKTGLLDLFPFMHPWHCLACCPHLFAQQGGHLDPGGGLLHSLSVPREYEMDGELPTNAPSGPGFFEKPPARIQKIIDQKERILSSGLGDLEDLWPENAPKHLLISIND